MKAIVYRENGSPDVLRYEDIPQPTPADNEVLIKVLAASINPLDWRMMRGIPGLLGLILSRGKGKLSHPGVDVAGVVESVGSKVTELKPGDEVFGTCRGSFAEYACAPERTLAIKAAGISFDQAAALPVAGITALQGLHDHAKIQPGQSVLINGAAGGVGTFAIQIAKHFGAHVTGVCSTKNVGMVRSLGADRAIDYTIDDFTASTERYDIILDNIGNHSLSQYRRILTPKGRLVIVGGGKEVSKILTRALAATLLSLFIRQKLRFFGARIKTDDLNTLASLVSSGKLSPVIDRHYSLAHAADAFRYLEEGHARAKVMIGEQYFSETSAGSAR